MKKNKKERKPTIKSIRRPASPIRSLQLRNMRLTRELDRLSTAVAAQGDLIRRIYQALQEKRLMPFDPPSFIDPGATLKTEPASAPTLAKMEKAQGRTPPMENPIMFGSVRSDVKNYTVRAKRGETIVGWLTADGKWTFDPKEIGHFNLKEEAQRTIAQATLPEGARPEIEEHRD